MISPIQPSAVYDAGNEAQFRTQVRQSDGLNVKKDEAVAQLIMLNDDGSPGYFSIVGGVPTWTAIS